MDPATYGTPTRIMQCGAFPLDEVFAREGVDGKTQPDNDTFVFGRMRRTAADGWVGSSPTCLAGEASLGRY
jgi:hypothetical protein